MPPLLHLQLLFFGFALLLHSAPAALLLLIICGTYYKRRTGLEGSVLEQAFGSVYRSYQAKTPSFIPFTKLQTS
jgi:protein-S-isoprenylcysteine O-methyltransferase Ste14